MPNFNGPESNGSNPTKPNPISNDNQFENVIIDLNAVILSLNMDREDSLTVLTISQNKNLLPWGPYHPNVHKTMEQGLRHWVKSQTDIDLNYVEQLYTYGDSGRFGYGDPNRHIITTGYLAFIEPYLREKQAYQQWSGIYQHFPWEDFRQGRPAILDDFILPKLFEWSDGVEVDKRINRCFGQKDDIWQEENILHRFEIMYEAKLVFEAVRDDDANMASDINVSPEEQNLPTGRYMQYDHRRILATALGRMRSKIKCRPVIFDLMPSSFTLFELQKSTEAILGYHLHKQNFRRFVERENLVAKIGKIRPQPSGRPAQLYEYNKQLINSPQLQGLKIGNSSSAY
ncbi:MAG: NAD regulator [Alphaproteobacteria bacterium]|nr:NAD regulator [Alphaproteobacteria bacterium]